MVRDLDGLGAAACRVTCTRAVPTPAFMSRVDSQDLAVGDSHDHCGRDVYACDVELLNVALLAGFLEGHGNKRVVVSSGGKEFVEIDLPKRSSATESIVSCL